MRERQCARTTDVYMEERAFPGGRSLATKKSLRRNSYFLYCVRFPEGFRFTPSSVDFTAMLFVRRHVANKRVANFSHARLALPTPASAKRFPAVETSR